MKQIVFVITLLALATLGSAEEDGVGVRGIELRSPRKWAPIGLSANAMSIATGQPSLVLMSHGSAHIPVWSLSGRTAGQSVAGLVTGLPSECAAVRVEIVVTTTDAATSPEFEDAYRVHLSQMEEDAAFTDRYVLGAPVHTALPAAPLHSRTIVLESYFRVDPSAPRSEDVVCGHQRE
ncbi:MAG: hypothetical protein KDK97_06240 [Verrucomicrobiales bacterium]|nr:hypothetical protein [Verrucomicrobiales bacterium]